MNSSTAGFAKTVGSSHTNQLPKRQIVIKRDRLDKIILLKLAWCTLPALLMLRMGYLSAGSIWCFVFLLAFLAQYGLKRNIPAFVALTIAALPALGYTRVFFFYNSIVILLGLGVGLWFVCYPQEGLRLWNNLIIRWFFIVGTIYWLVSVLLTRHYAANLSFMEMLFSMASICLLARHPQYLASALAGLSISIFSVAIGMIGLGDRMGAAIIEGEQLGNPVIFGLPAALVLVLAVADNGKWLFLQNSTIMRNALIAICGVFLLLSTSRTSWLVALLGLVVTVFYQSQQRRKIFIGFLLMGCVLVGVLQTESGEKVSQYFEMATDSGRTLNQMTTGRSDMWHLFPQVLEDSPLWGVGPGLGKQAYAEYSWLDRDVTFRKGSQMAWHSIYMQIGVETGLIGLAILIGFLSKLLFSGLLYRRVTKSVVPLMSIICFMTMGVAGHMLEGLGGLFLGLAFLGTNIPPQKTLSNSPTLREYQN